MKRSIWEVVGSVILGALAITLLFDMIKPYALVIIVSLLVLAIGRRAYSRHREW